MKRVLYVNAHSHITFSGHKILDVEMIKNLTKISIVDVIIHEDGWYEKLPQGINKVYYVLPDYKWVNKNCNVLTKLYAYRTTPERIFYIEYVLNLIQKLDVENKYDMIYMATMDFVTFSLNYRIFSDLTKIVQVVHDTAVFNKKLLLRFLFERYKKKIKFVVSDECEKEYFTNKCNVKKEQLFYIPHPLIPDSENEDVRSAEADISTYDIVGISGSNDEKKIEEIVSFEKQTQFFEKNRIKCLIRSKVREYDNGWLKVIKATQNIDKNRYRILLSSSRAVILPFSMEYGMRASGNMMDAIKYEKPIIGTSFGTMIYYHNKYGDIFSVYDNIEQLPEIIRKSLSINDSAAFGSIKEQHSDDRIKDALLGLLDSMS